MRPLALLALAAAVSTAALALAAPADARLSRHLLATADTLSLERTDGRVVLLGRGALIGRLDRGSVRITDRPVGPDTDVTVWGEDGSRDIGRFTTVYTGTELRFRVFDGSWRVVATGDGIDVSAVLDGTAWVRGDRGRYSVDGGRYRPVTAEWRRLELGD